MAAFLLLKALREQARGLRGPDVVAAFMLLVLVLVLAVGLPLIYLLDSLGVFG